MSLQMLQKPLRDDPRHDFVGARTCFRRSKCSATASARLGLRSAGSNMPRRLAQARKRRKNHQRKKKPRARNSNTGPVAHGGWEDNLRRWVLFTATSAGPMWRKSHSKALSPRRPREPRRMRASGGQIAASSSAFRRFRSVDARKTRLSTTAALSERGYIFMAVLSSFAQMCWPGRLPALAPAKAIAAASSGESANETATVFRSSRYWP